MKTSYTYEDAVAASTTYFNGDELAAKVFIDKYALRDKENNLVEQTPADMHHRIAKEFARIEKNKFATPMSEEEIFGLLDGFKYIVPQGSPMAGIGNPYQIVSLSNCYVVPSPLDSYGSITYTDQELVQISKRRGGVGVDVSNLRPAGTATNNAARSSTGVLSFMERYSNTIREVGQAGRRGALMISLDIHHPQSADFATVKNDDKKVTGANISLRLSDEFLNAVTEGTDFELRWPVDAREPEIKSRTDARALWKTIINSAWQRAEPGLLFWDSIIKESPADCYSDQGFKTISTNPCSEIPLSAYDSCRLLVLNLFSYVINPFQDNAKFDYALFHKHAQIAQRLMDDLVDLELECIDRIITKIKADPEPEFLKQTEYNLWNSIKTACLNGRRTGTGFTALGDTLAALGLKYGSKDSIGVSEKIYKTLKNGAYRSSVDMAKELGAFPIYDRYQETNCPFIQRLQEEDPKLHQDMQVWGRRNIALLTIAPTGTVSIMTQTTSGLEPAFLLSYTRRKKVNPNDQNVRIDFVDQNGDSWQEFTVYHPKLKMWMDITGETDATKSPWFGACANDLNWVNRVELQAAMQKHCDHAISSTINLPNNATEENVAAIYEAAWKAGCKGITVYRDGCRSGVMIAKSETKQVVDVFAKRPRDLEAIIAHPKVKGQEYFVIIGLDEVNSRPYEVFAGKNGFFSKSIDSGVTHKVKRGHYQLLDNDGAVAIENITEHLEADEEALTRMVSISLRHGVDIEYVVHQLEKVSGDLTSLSKAMARQLKKFIKDGTEVKGEDCGECHQPTLERSNGCVICKNCGWTKCS
ncbi:adenosylcobalamin-dependent ribonucleoside-diphosphate reductase [Acinetobacter sp.]|uniref:adenosylcobalamin-dependent ribonucleoside-diphosphate reductase n=1 Tax=Acinetobacter sp. TaxID=472 RepID=UPI003751E2DE